MNRDLVIGGKIIGQIDSITIEPPPPPRLDLQWRSIGNRTIEGSIEIKWEGDALARWCDRARRSATNQMLRMLRPQMPRRAFRRTRARVRAALRP